MKPPSHNRKNTHLKQGPTSFSASSSFFFLLSGIKSSNQLSSRLVKKKSMSFRTNTKAKTCNDIYSKNKFKELNKQNWQLYFQKSSKFSAEMLLFILDRPAPGLPLFGINVNWSISQWWKFSSYLLFHISEIVKKTSVNQMDIFLFPARHRNKVPLRNKQSSLLSNHSSCKTG